MSYECFDIEESDGVAHLRLNRPDEFNTLIPPFWAELPAIVSELSDSGRVRVLMLSSTGRHFSAGMDLSVFTDSKLLTAEGEIGRRRSNLRLNLLHLQHAFSCLEEARMPVLVAVQGGCIGGAIDLITAADCRYATNDAWFCIQEINIGMTADVGTLQRLPKLIPDGVAREHAYTGRRMSAARAREVGLVNEVFADHATMLDAVHEIAREIAAKSPLAVYGTKQAVIYSRDHSVSDSLQQIATWQTGMLQPTDVVESLTARVESRAPAFDDLLEAQRGL